MRLTSVAPDLGCLRIGIVNVCLCGVLHRLAREFGRLSLPRTGRYVGRPPSLLPRVLVGAGAAALAGIVIGRGFHR